MVTKLKRRQGGFTLVEIMIVVAIIGLLAAIAVPSALRARKRGQATSTLDTLRILDAACDQWATDNGKSPGNAPTGLELQKYVKVGTKLYNDLTGGSALDALSNPITLPVVDKPPLLSDTTFGALSDVADSVYWNPYYSGS
jgi:type IV pilus assembly protein PilA